MAKQYLDHPQLKSKCSFPLPAKTSFRDGKRSQDAILGFEYCEKLPPEMAAILRCRVYRLDPPIDMKKIGETTTTIDLWEGPLPFKSEDYETTFYHKYGAGSYKVIVEEQGLSGRVCDIWFTLSDREGYPPKIDDRTLCFDKPAAKDYIDWRFRRGEPVSGVESDKNQGEDDFMEVGSGVKQGTATVLVEGLLNMADKQINVAQDDAKRAKEEAARLREQSPAVGTNPAQNAVNGAIDLALQSAGKVVDSVMNHAGARYDPPDPIGMVTKIMDMMPKPVDQTPTILAVIQESNKTVLQMVLNQNQELRQEVQAMRAAQLAPATNGHVKTFDEELDSFSRKAEALGYKRGDGAPAGDSKEDLMKMIVQNMPMITAALTAAANIIAPIFRGAQANPAPQPPAPAQPPMVVQAEPAPQPQPQPDPNSPQARTLAFLQDLEKPFLAHLLSPEYNGFTLALHILTQGAGGSMETIDGRAKYNEIKTHLGKQPDGSIPLDRMIRQYPPIWNRAQSNQPAYGKFLAEFLSYDEAQAVN